MKNLKTSKILWAIAAVLAIIVSVVGVVNPGIYNSAEPIVLIPGSIAQDIMTIPAGLVLLYLVFKTGKDNYKKQIVAFGLVGYLFYAYGLYVIGRLFTPFYLAYMAIFAVSFYALVYGLLNVEKDLFQKITLTDRLRKYSVAFAFLQPIVFYPLWTMMLLSEINAGKSVDFLPVFVIDLCFVMPAFIIAGILGKRKNGFGLFALPAMFVLAFVELAPLGVAEFIKPKYGLTIDPVFMILFMTLSILFLALAIFDLKNLKANT